MTELIKTVFVKAADIAVSTVTIITESLIKVS
jgi:hypothetical protein